MKIALAALLALTPVSSLASPVPNHSQAGYSSSRTCFKTEYREEYIPAQQRVLLCKSWNDTLRFLVEILAVSTNQEHIIVGM